LNFNIVIYRAAKLILQLYLKSVYLKLYFIIDMPEELSAKGFSEGFSSAQIKIKELIFECEKLK